MIAWMLIAILMGTPSSLAEQITSHYADKEIEELKQVCGEADDLEMDLLCRYRLYPLTEDQGLLENLPELGADATAREYAILSGLWGYRAAEASMFRAIRLGSQAQALLEKAIEADAGDPLVMLVEAQSLLFTPSVAGGDTQKAVNRLKELTAQLDEDVSPYVPLMEAQIWKWYAKDQLDHTDADDLRSKLLADNPPSLFREFLTSAST